MTEILAVGSSAVLGVCVISIIVILSAVLAWWRPWEVSAFHFRYLALKAALLLVNIKLALRFCRVRCQLAIKRLMLDAKFGYLIIRCRIIHKFQRRAKTPNEKS